MRRGSQPTLCAGPGAPPLKRLRQGLGPRNAATSSALPSGRNRYAAASFKRR
jgi:hypothetical protein